MDEETVICQTPTPGKGPTRIARWKYDLVRRAILSVLAAQKNGLNFRDLPAQVELRLTEVERTALGSIGWYTTTVKLDLEVKGEISRLAGAGPQRLVLGGSDGGK